jgi:hypothetical protein
MKKLVSKTQITFFTLVLMLVLPISTYAVDGQRKISQTPSTTFPIVINQSGSYVLTSNLVVPTEQPDVNAIEITVNDVTIDLNGHMIRGPFVVPDPEQATGNGIYADEKLTITIKNGKIWGFGSAGIYFICQPFQFPATCWYGAGHQIENVQAVNNGVGIKIYGSLVTNCAANNNRFGIDAISCTITNSTFNNNQLDGMTTQSSTIINCIANSNLDRGIYSEKDVITNCNCSHNGSIGIVATHSTMNNCSCISNYASGFEATNCSIINSTANLSSVGDGIIANRCNITNCRIIDNGNNGIWAKHDNYIEGCSVKGNGDNIGSGYGIYISPSQENNIIIRNTAAGNASGNYQDASGKTTNYMPICGLDATDNCNYQF